MHSEEETLHGDSGYIGADKRPEAIKKIRTERKSSISLTEDHHLSKSSLKADSMQRKRKNTKNHLSAAKLNMFLQL